jgi:hypothetical protein
VEKPSVHSDFARRIDDGPDKRPIGIELLYVGDGVNVRDLPECDAVGRLLRENAVTTLDQPASVRES